LGDEQLIIKLALVRAKVAERAMMRKCSDFV